jgi:hypothetical protein
MHHAVSNRGARTSCVRGYVSGIGCCVPARASTRRERAGRGARRRALGSRVDQAVAGLNGMVKVSLTVVGTSAPLSLQVKWAVEAFMLPSSTGTQR